MAESSEELVTRTNEPLVGFQIKLPDTPQNRERVKGAVAKLEKLRVGGKKIFYGFGTPEDGTIYLEAGDLPRTAADGIRRLLGKKKPVNPRV